MKSTIGIIAGSLRREAFSKKIAEAVIKMAPKNFEFKMVSIDDLPLYKQDFDMENEPKTYAPFRKKIENLDGIIFITPEHNRSVPAALKNAIDIASRPHGKNKWDGKPGAVFSSSPGNISGFGANHHLRQSLSFLNIPVMQQPEVYLAKIDKSLDEKGNLTDKRTLEFLQKAVDAYIVWFEKNK